MTGIDKAREIAEKLKTETKQTEEAQNLAAKESLEMQRQRLAAMYKDDVGAGTEDIGVDDLNIPQLKLVQSNKRIDLPNGKRAEDGFYFRTDTKEQMEYVDVILLVVRKVYTLNFKKDGTERQHIYFGVYEGSNEPFRMFCRGWSLAGSREFLTEVKTIQGKYRLPMYALKLRLSSMPRSGTMKEGGDYAVFSTVFSILKDEETGAPMAEDRAERVEVLRRFVERFGAIEIRSIDEEDEPVRKTPASLPEASANKEPEPTAIPKGQEEEVKADEIPF